MQSSCTVRAVSLWTLTRFVWRSRPRRTGSLDLIRESLRCPSTCVFTRPTVTQTNNHLHRERQQLPHEEDYSLSLSLCLSVESDADRSARHDEGGGGRPAGGHRVPDPVRAVVLIRYRTRVRHWRLFSICYQRHAAAVHLQRELPDPGCDAGQLWPRQLRRAEDQQRSGPSGWEQTSFTSAALHFQNVGSSLNVTSCLGMFKSIWQCLQMIKWNVGITCNVLTGRSENMLIKTFIGNVRYLWMGLRNQRCCWPLTFALQVCAPSVWSPNWTWWTKEPTPETSWRTSCFLCAEVRLISLSLTLITETVIIFNEVIQTIET